MPLDPDWKAKVLEWLGRRSVAPPFCSLCSTRDWGLVDQVVAPPILSDKGIEIGQSVPFVALFCKNCGNTYFLAAMPMGIITDPPKGG